MPVRRPIVMAGLLAAVLSACGRGDIGAGPALELAPRTYMMGFSGVPPRPEMALVLRTIDLWAQRADAALIFLEPPWTALLAGEDPEALVRNDPLALAGYYRAKGLRVVANIDLTNGLDRSSETPPPLWPPGAASPSPRCEPSTAATWPPSLPWCAPTTSAWPRRPT